MCLKIIKKIKKRKKEYRIYYELEWEGGQLTEEKFSDLESAKDYKNMDEDRDIRNGIVVQICEEWNTDNSSFKLAKD